MVSDRLNAVEQAYSLNIQRSVGSIGSRRLKLRILSEETVQQELFLLQEWTCESNKVRSRVLIEQGSPLEGTSVEFLEEVGVKELHITVRIPGSERVFSPPVPFRTYIFGSEFTYEDFRFFLPPGWVQRDAINGDFGWHIPYANGFVSHLFDLNKLSPLPITSVWCDLPSTQPTREVTYHYLREISGVAMPMEMRARQSGTSLVSIMTLESVNIA